MKNLLILITIMLVGVGCSRNLTEEEKKLSKKVVGSYESFPMKRNRFDLLENGKVIFHVDGEKIERKWEVHKKEVLIGINEGDVAHLIYKVEPKGDLTGIGVIVDGKRINNPKVVTKYRRPPMWKPLEQCTFKKIK